MEQFTEEETERLNKVLSIEINPFIHGYGQRAGLPLGEKSAKWLFETRMNLPLDATQEVEFSSQGVSDQERIRILNDILEERDVSSAPKWWEMNFFEAEVLKLWEFFVEQCHNNYARDPLTQEYFDGLTNACRELDRSRNIVRVSNYNKEIYSEEEVVAALKVVDNAYPLDFRDYNESPWISRSPLDKIKELISPELCDLEAVFTKRWFEFKILDELASFTSYIHDGERDSDLSKKIARQLRYYMHGQILALGRMVEHYRWKFSYEADALKGIQSTLASKERGKKGGQASERTKMENLECLLQELERLADLFPRIGEEAIFKQAYSNAGQRRKMPKSQKTIDEYGTILRSESPYKTRYDAVFGKNA